MNALFRGIPAPRVRSWGRMFVFLAIVFAVSGIGYLSAEARDSDPEIVEASVAGGSDSQDVKRKAISDRLEDLGASELEAEASVEALSDADVQVLYDNPDMIQAAGDVDEGTAIIIVLGVVIVVLLIVIAA